MGNFEISWILQGEKYPKIYTKIKENQILIEEKRNFKITTKFEKSFPSNGFSLPLLLSLERNPDISLNVNIVFK